MKRRILSSSFLALFVLLFCTFLAPKIESEMRVQVELKHISGSNPKRNSNVPMSALQWDDGTEQLYCVIEGSGWESGQRVTEIPPQYYTIVMDMSGKNGGYAMLGPGTEYDLIISACRRPERGSLVEVVEEFETGEDTYLVYCPTGIEKPEMLPNVLEPVSSASTAILARSQKAKFPFFEMRMRNSLKKIEAADVRVYSMTDARQFLQALPWITGIGLIALLGIILCAANCVFASRPDNVGLILWVNAGLAGSGLCALPTLAQRFDLPASLMPGESILDIGHYISQFQNIFTTLEALGENTLTAVWEQTVTQCMGMAGICAGILTMLLIAEAIICRQIRKRKTQTT